jgi:hypothetical protein
VSDHCSTALGTNHDASKLVCENSVMPYTGVLIKNVLGLLKKFTVYDRLMLTFGDDLIFFWHIESSCPTLSVFYCDYSLTAHIEHLTYIVPVS